MSAPRRRRRVDDTETRDQLIAATAEIMLEEGYAAATSRRVAAKAGVHSALVHYYFPTMDELFLAVFRRGAEANFARQRQALTSPSPMRTLWELSSDPHGTALLLEFMALSNHRKEIRAEIAAYAERFREGQLAALTFILHSHGVDLETVPPLLVSFLIASTARSLIMETDLGVTLGHKEALAFVEDFLGRFEGTPGRTVTLPERPAAE
ncbi:TetR/AcrR family transcriptional regulator [Nocardia sp. BMG111209]|uniref:TetR/AcrR family transcriptional regulator n=1 Tax=Nocardia sp. BMG111209 TaxID=1160137 RepID=UPI00037A9CF5|nr:TetR/AcrR family transcriptional regulator [Nocardia sp. BMG111209]